jgi:SOS-response transcriptional repressor LexA
MDHQWDKPGKGKIDKTRPKKSQDSLLEPDQGQNRSAALDETLAVWDFERSSGPAEEVSFHYTRRPALQPGYRLVGDEVSAARAGGFHRSGATALAEKVVLTSRPNRYNASVKMLAGDTGPAPWEDWDKISYLKMPIIGEVAAGRYDVTVAYHEPGSEADADFVLVNSGEVKVNRTTFALRVRGQSMIENEIDDGDIVIVQSQNWADDGDFVIACLADSSDAAGFVTLKRFYRHRQADRVVLQPANQSLNPIHILPNKGDASSEDLDAVKIQGKVITIIKSNGL